MSHFTSNYTTRQLLEQLDGRTTLKDLRDPIWGAHRRSWLEMRNRQAEESDVDRIRRLYGPEGRDFDLFNKLPSGTAYFYDLGLARKNLDNYLPFLTKSVERVGPGGTDDSPLMYHSKNDPFQQISHGENWHSAMEYQPFEDHKNIRGLVNAVKETDVRRGEDREKALKNWAKLFNDYGYKRTAQELWTHNEPPSAEPKLKEELKRAQPLIDLTVDDEPPEKKAKGGGYKITQHTKKQAKKLGVEVKPSQLGKKKIDVFRGGRKVASVGHKDYMDYPSYRECCGTKMAESRRAQYKARHENSRHKVGTPSFYADKLLW